MKAAGQKTEEKTSFQPRLGTENAAQNSGERHRRGEGRLGAEEAADSKRENDAGKSPAGILRNYPRNVPRKIRFQTITMRRRIKKTPNLQEESETENCKKELGRVICRLLKSMQLVMMRSGN